MQPSRRLPYRHQVPVMSALMAVIATLAPVRCWAAQGATPLPGLIWGVPFLGVLASIGLFPMFAPRLWHRRMGTVCVVWIALLVVPQALHQGLAMTAAEVWRALLLEYLPFVTLLLALFTVGGGILVQGGPWGRPAGNTLLLAIGTALAGVMGTTGAAMVLIHPLLRSNAHRARKTHLVMFFIILVANVGGVTSPLGNPPQYVGFLEGVPFFWPIRYLLAPMLVVAAILLAAFHAYDRHLAASEPASPPTGRLRLRGTGNIALLVLVVGAVLLQGLWTPGRVRLLGQPVGIQQLMAIAVFLLVTLVSIRFTPLAVRQANMFAWAPMAEVAKLFAAIFITITPMLAILSAGLHGPAAPLLRLTENAAGQPVAAMYFWLSGVVSAFLDSAPAYLVFFQMAGGDAAVLTGRLNHLLVAIAAGANFFGALTYIGNAPNMMVQSIAAHRGIRMPGFFGYIGWVAGILLPVYALLTLLFFV